jgi:hypothetical protein
MGRQLTKGKRHSSSSVTSKASPAAAHDCNAGLIARELTIAGQFISWKLGEIDEVQSSDYEDNWTERRFGTG